MATNSALRCKPSSSSKEKSKIKNMNGFQNVVAFLEIVCSKGCCKCNKLLGSGHLYTKNSAAAWFKNARWLEEIPSWAHSSMSTDRYPEYKIQSPFTCWNTQLCVYTNSNIDSILKAIASHHINSTQASLHFMVNLGPISWRLHFSPSSLKLYLRQVITMK